MNRRRFLARASGMGAALALGPSFWERALAAPAHPGPSPYGDLLPPDANGVQLPAGFTSRVVARALTPVAATGYAWHIFPDGGACVATDDGGWVYVSNCENPPPAGLPLGALADLLGGVSAMRFDADGNIVDAYRILGGTQTNCAGGLTPWGTWLSCEEYEEGLVWECDPFGGAPVARPSLGRLVHEMAAVDPDRHQVYLSEDMPDGLLYRYTAPPGVWGSGAALDGGTLEAMAVDAAGAVTWLPVPDPPAVLRRSVPGATAFNGGEGLIFDQGRVYLTTKNDHRVWVHDVAAQTMTVLYDGLEHGAAAVLTGVDNIVASASHDLYVAEDGGNMEVCIITPDLVVAPVVRLTGPEHGQPNPTPIPTVSEVTGLAFSPDGNRLYLNSQRGGVFGISYEVTGPWRGGSLAAQPAPTPTTTTTVPAASTTVARPAAGGPGGEIAATGGGALGGWWAAAAAAGGGALWRLRQRATRSRP